MVTNSNGIKVWSENPNLFSNLVIVYPLTIKLIIKQCVILFAKLKNKLSWCLLND
ncbi:hypothetical protein MACH09_39900 [Vibrio sp. MACH09]|nr:hypothetical protein MACH09_39900 [Vibrio sp. MACH09]